MERKPATSTTVLIIGAGTSGLAAAACLTSQRIPVIILERDDAIAPLWRYRTYDRLCLHLPKKVCELSFHPHPPSAPTYLPCTDFLRYIDEYATMFGLGDFLLLRRQVDSAQFDPAAARWQVTATNLESGAVEEYEARFMVVATGENDEPVLPVGIPGLDRFTGEAIHSSQFRTGKPYKGLDVLVVGCGNSGMEIAYDLAECGARASIVARSLVFPKISYVEGKDVTFENGKQLRFDAIILATGYRSTDKKWLKGDNYLIGDDGMGKQELSEHWKGKNGLYCAGLMRKGLFGGSMDAMSITKDINSVLQSDLKQKMA